MNGRIFLSLLAVAILLQNCSQKPVEVKNAVKREIATSKTTASDKPETIHPEYNPDTTMPAFYRLEVEEDEEGTPLKARLRYPNFTLVLHGFKGYEVFNRDGERFFNQSYASPEQAEEAELNLEEELLESGEVNPNYLPTVIVKKDTLHLSEDLEDRFNNVLVQIIPNNKTDSFKLSLCYLTSLNEVIDHRKYPEKELERMYNQAEHILEQTKFGSLPDSARYFFRTVPHTPDMEAVTVANNKVVPVKPRNTQTQMEYEERLFRAELTRIKKKYSLRDTTVLIEGEYEENNVSASLTKNKKLYNYSYDSFLVKIERMRNNKVVETKYVEVSIMYGC